VIVAAGAVGKGEEVYAEPGGAGGSPGKLVLAARFLDIGDIHMRLKALNLSAGGESDFRQMQVAAEFIGVAVMFINGHDVVYPVGTRARAKIAQEVVIPAAAIPAVTPDLAPPTPPSPLTVTSVPTAPAAATVAPAATVSTPIVNPTAHSAASPAKEPAK
jgi:hypothetical protein